MRIFTVNRESESSLKSKTKTVRPRSSRLRIFIAAAPLLIAGAFTQVGLGQARGAQNPQNIFNTPAAQAVQTLCQPQVIGNRRIPKESVLARLFSRQNDLYDPLVVERDFNSLWNTGYFDDVRIERADSDKCVQLVIYVREKPTIREINYKGLNAVSQSDVLERNKKAKVGLTVESQYDPTKIKKAENTLKELLAEHGTSLRPSRQR